MRSLKNSIREWINSRLAVDFCRIDPNRLGRDLIQDVRRLSGSKPPSEMVILDIGANVGKATVEYANEFPDAQIFAIEPARQSYIELRGAVVNYQNVITCLCALGSQEVTAKLNVFEGSDQNSLLFTSPVSSDFVGTDFFRHLNEENVQVRTLDDLAEELSIERVDFMKVDTQGYELQVLQGAKRMFTERRINVVQLEANFVPLYEGQPTFGALVQEMDRFDFGFVGFYQQAYQENRYLRWADALFAPRFNIRLIT